MPETEPADAVDVDLITLEVINWRLAEISRAMEHLLFHGGYSPILRESNDGSCCILDSEGNVVMASGMPLHVACYHRTALAVLQRFGHEMQPGDSFLSNDPYTAGVFHVPDLSVISPVFYRGEMVALCASIAHKPDVGGTVPGSSGAGSREVFHEGVAYPPVRYATQAGIDPAIDEILRRNSRTPTEVAGDVRAQVGCARIGAVRLQELCDAYGPEVIKASFKRFLAHSEARLRRAISQWPDGTSEAEAFLDNDGADGETPVRVHVRIEKRGSDIALDFSGSDEQGAGPINVRPQSTETASFLGLLAVVDPTIPLNDGIRRVVRITNPEAKITHARYPAPVNNYFIATHLIYTCVQSALGTFTPDRVIAPDGLGGGATTIGYSAPKLGTSVLQYELQVTSLGATEATDGVFSALPMTHLTMNTPIEVLETEYPIRIWAWTPRCDSGGAGRHRGGVGFVKEYELLEDADFTVRMGHFSCGAWGVDGGRAPLKARCTIIRSTGEQEHLTPISSLRLSAGDRIRVETPGGGGVGDPFQRQAELVLDDVRNGYISLEAARRDYGVCIEQAADLELNYEQTLALRASGKAQEENAE